MNPVCDIGHLQATTVAERTTVFVFRVTSWGMAEIAKTADHALRILLEVGQNGPMTQSQLGRTLGLNRTVVHRLLATLEGRGFVTRQDDGYLPGAIFVQIAGEIRPDLRNKAKQAMTGLADRVGETVVLHVPAGDDAVVLECVVPDDQLVRVEPKIGRGHSLAVSAGGRAILAFVDEARIRSVCNIMDQPDVLRRQLESVRQLGYALSHDEAQEGVHGLAVPVFSTSNQVLGAIAILTPTSRANRLMEFTDDLLHTASTLGGQLAM